MTIDRDRMGEFLTSDEFKSYRKAQAAVIAGYVHSKLRHTTAAGDLERLDGALELAVKLVRLPEGMAPAALLPAIAEQVDRDFADVSAVLIAQRFKEIEE
jgi:hypothetical protein